MMRAFLALLSGLIFGAGLAFSGMVDLARVQGFLDVTGKWDPTLAFVMGGAIFPMAIAWLTQSRMLRPLAGDSFNLPGTTQITGKLAIGAILFGIGWGISGLCPGPALADLALAPVPAIIFMVAMLSGMTIHRFTSR